MIGIRISFVENLRFLAAQCVRVVTFSSNNKTLDSLLNNFFCARYAGHNVSPLEQITRKCHNFNGKIGSFLECVQCVYCFDSTCAVILTCNGTRTLHAFDRVRKVFASLSGNTGRACMSNGPCNKLIPIFLAARRSRHAYKSECQVLRLPQSNRFIYSCEHRAAQSLPIALKV